MTDLVSSPSWVVSLAALPSIASGVWVYWRWWIERTDKKTDGAITREQNWAKELEAQRAALSREQADLFDRLRSEVARVQARLTDVEQDRDRGWDLARW